MSTGQIWRGPVCSRPSGRDFVGVSFFEGGHRKPDGEFDSDMVELHIFVGTFLIQYLTEVKMPLIHVRNEKWQNNVVPDDVPFFHELNDQVIRDEIERGSDGIWLPGLGLVRLPRKKSGAARRRLRREPPGVLRIRELVAALVAVLQRPNPAANTVPAHGDNANSKRAAQNRVERRARFRL